MATDTLLLIDGTILGIIALIELWYIEYLRWRLKEYDKRKERGE